MVYLGNDLHTKEPVHLTDEARRQGVYVVGTTGTGKTTLLKSIVCQDMAAGSGVCVLDPHGDLISELLELVPKQRAADVFLFAPGSQFERPQGLNLLACDRDDPRQRDLVCSTVIGTLRKLFFYSWGPRMEDLLRNSILALLHTPDTTLLDVLLLLTHMVAREQLLRNVTDDMLRYFWDVEFASYDRRQRAEIISSSLNKLGRFLTNPIVRNVIVQPRNAFSLREIMDSGKILFVDLSKGELGEDNSSLLGAVIVNLVLIAALERRDTPANKRRPFHLIVDEYQSFSTETFPTLQSEARKYGITVMVAHQYRAQLDDLNRGSTLNVANLITLRVTGDDSQELARQFDNTPPAPRKKMQPIYRQVTTYNNVPIYAERGDPTGAGRQFVEVDETPRLYSDVAAERANELATIPNYIAMCRFVVGANLVEYPVRIVSMWGAPSAQVAATIRSAAASRGTPRAAIESMVKEKISGLEAVETLLPPAYEGEEQDLPPA